MKKQNIPKDYKETKIGLIPLEWEYQPIKKHINQLTGYAFKSEMFNQENRGVRLCRGINITKGDLRFDKKNEMFFENVENVDLEKYYLQEKDIVISMDGSLVGRNFGVLNEEFLPMFLVQRVSRLRTKKDILQYYLYYWISSSHFIRYVDSVKTSSGIPHISSKDINNFKIAIPPIKEQEKIATILNDWDKAIETQEKMIAEKEKLKKGLMQQLFNRKLKVDNEKWKEVKLGDLGKIFNGLIGKTKDDFGKGKPYVSYLNVFNESFVNKNTKFDYVDVLEGENQTELKYGDMIFTTSSETAEEVGMSSVILFNPNESLYLNSFCFGLRMEKFNFLLPEFAVYILRSLNFRRKIYRLAQGSTRFNLSKRSFKKIKISIPPLKTQEKIANILMNCDREISILKEQLVTFKQQKQGLMQQLLTGKTRVKV